MSQLHFFLRSEDVEEEHLIRLGKISPSQYFLQLQQSLLNCGLNVQPYEQGQPLLKLVKQSVQVKLGGGTFLVAAVCQPLPTQKKSKPSGVIFDDCSFLQVKEFLLYDVSLEVLYSYEYSYHFGIWDYDNEKEVYQLRYDREVVKRNPPRKAIEHFHVYFDDPHFDTKFMKLSDVLNFIYINWDHSNNKFHIKDLVY